MNFDALAPMTGMTPNLQPVLFRGRLAAAAGPDRFILAPHIEVLEDDHPDRRFVSLMCFHARDVLIGRAEGPYTDAEAERVARSSLISDADLGRSLHHPDAALAEYFVTPLDQIAARRMDLACR
jgi:hypothetical protein